MPRKKPPIPEPDGVFRPSFPDCPRCGFPGTPRGRINDLIYARCGNRKCPTYYVEVLDTYLAPPNRCTGRTA